MKVSQKTRSSPAILPRPVKAPVAPMLSLIFCSYDHLYAFRTGFLHTFPPLRCLAYPSRLNRVSDVRPTPALLPNIRIYRRALFRMRGRLLIREQAPTYQYLPPARTACRNKHPHIALFPRK